MTLLKYKPRRSHNIPMVNRFFDDFFLRDWDENLRFPNSQPKVNILDKADQFELQFAVPGLKKEDFNIKLDNDRLSVSFEKSEERSEDEEKFTLKEFSFERFERVFNLPETIQKDKVEAKYENGLLTIVVPKSEEAKVQPVKEIKVG